ncbi:hypothetical protein HAX54_051382 [Datura stramonium]|uniref:Uncharacterized protein n=1 Tax=Datura stramonium TaxID=4076 RepID=A0ABS8SY96_DATST|nr:hypothetical protein [Datura stramonium]
MAHSRAKQQHTGESPGAARQLQWCYARSEAPSFLRFGRREALPSQCNGACDTEFISWLVIMNRTSGISVMVSTIIMNSKMLSLRRTYDPWYELQYHTMTRNMEL